MADTLDDTQDDGIDLADVHDAPPRPLSPLDSQARRRALVDQADTGPLPDWQELRARRTGPVARLEVPGAMAVGSDDLAQDLTEAIAALKIADLANSEWGQALQAEVAALKKGAARKSLLRTWAERILSALAGSAVAILVWALTKAEQKGATAEAARAREAVFQKLVESAATCERRDLIQQGQIDALIDRLRYPVQGPPAPPQVTP